MRNSTKTLLKALGIMLAVTVVVSVGYIVSGLHAKSIGGDGRTTASSIGIATQDMATGKSAGASAGSPVPGGGALGAPSSESPTANGVGVFSPGSPATDRLVISTAQMSLHVGSVEKSIESIRRLAVEYGAVISDLTLDAGSQPVTGPLPLERGAGAVSLPSPASAHVTLRVPSAKLDRVHRRLGNWEISSRRTPRRAMSRSST